jgi:outer membrane protein assembly factor BamB
MSRPPNKRGGGSLRWLAAGASALGLIAAAPSAAPSTNWPAFRGPNASGVADSQGLPASWNTATGENIRWTATIPGLAHSSPIVWGDRLAADINTGRTVWKKDRKELPSWGTPGIAEPPGGSPELVTNASNFIRGYDPLTGEERWRLGGSSKITAPTPIFTNGLIIIASGRAPERPIFAVKPGARGDITLADGQSSNAFVAWHKTGRGSYMPTPLAYRDQLYVLANQGLLDAYDPRTGDDIYRQRIPHRGSGFSASPVAADGRIYLSSEDGDIFVVNAGDFSIAGRYAMGEPLMATPAIGGGTLYVRGEKRLFAIGR